MSKEYDLMFRDDDKLYDMIEDEINKKFTFKRLCKNIDVKDISDNTENEIDFKQISISGLEKDVIDSETMDYKKFSLNKLKSVVVEKGLIKDSSKLKKNELLNLLGVK